ncbi:hypothetical protein HZC00_05240 [Candidatus Kaiserbacteria bacterium]|nr:hypothetical protein [Candidatus Kaiserbacteria bacterium]
MRTLITGVAGAGKTTIVSELRKRGYRAIDLDDCDVCIWVNKETGKEAVYNEGAGGVWIERHRWQVVVPKLIDLLDSFPETEDVFVGGKVASVQVDEIKKIFDRMYVLKPADAIIDQRLSKRTSNIVNFAKTKEEREALIRGRNKFEQTCIDCGMVPLDNQGTVQEILEEILC